MNCTIWSRDLSRIKKSFQQQNISLQLEDGTCVGFQCSIQYNPQYGLSLKVEDADPVFALGELELKKREILDRLAKERLFEKNKNTFVPMLPQKIGLITSHGSAAYNDFVKTLQNSKFKFEVFTADSNMQGPQTEDSVVRALNALEKLNIELVVIIRGGGSKTDLFFLDNERIAREIAGCRFPVWTGIGHEIDTSVLDYLANRSFKTPTAVSEELVSRFVEMDRHLCEAKNRLKSTWEYRFNGEQGWVTEAMNGIQAGTRKLIDVLRISLKNSANALSVKVNTRLGTEKNEVAVAKSRIVSLPQGLIRSEREYLKARVNQFQLDKFQFKISQETKNVTDKKEMLFRFFDAGIKNCKKDIGYYKYRLNKDKILARFKSERASIKAKSATLKAYDPQTSLKRGFSLIYNKSGKLLKSVSEISPNETITTQLGDGKLTSIIKNIEGKSDE